MRPAGLLATKTWGRSPSTSTESTIAQAPQPLTDADWKHTIDGRYIRWEAPGPEAVGLQFDAFAAQKPNGPLPAWTVWGGHAGHRVIRYDALDDLPVHNALPGESHEMRRSLRSCRTAAYTFAVVAAAVSQPKERACWAAASPIRVERAGSSAKPDNASA